MKKIITILVCLLLVASFAVTAFAAGLEMTLTADKTTVNRGDTVTFTISMPELAGCTSAGFNLDGKYDTDVFEFVAGECTVEDTFIDNVGFTNGKLSGSFSLKSARDMSGSIFTIQMKVKDTAPYGKTTVDPTVSARANKAPVENVTVNALELNVVCVTHTPETNITKEATCKEAGEKVTVCTECGTTIKTEEIAKLPHTEKTEVTKEATCKEAGEKVTSCSVCGETIATETIAKLPHDNETVVTKEATCTEAGVKTTTCKVCGETTTEEIAKLPHDNETVVTKEATCTEAGEKVTTCKTCGESVTEVIEALGHTWDKGVVTVAPTTETEGEKVYTCTVCGETKTEVIPVVATPPMGDNTMIVPFVLLMVLSAAGVAVTVIGKKRAI